MQQLVGMGFDLYALQDFLESKGLWECEVDTLMAVFQSPNFVNVLKSASQQMLQPNMIGGMAPQG